VVSIPRSTISTPLAETYTNYDCQPMQTFHLPWYNGDVVANNKGANNMNNECIPARLKNGEIAEGSNARRVCRRVLTKREGPRPTPNHLCRHLCANDSQSHKRVDGFVCVIHICWGTRSENEMDKPIETRLATVKAAGKTACNLEYTCPHCGLSGRGPAIKRWHFDRCKLRPQ